MTQPRVVNGLTFEMAQTKVEGSKFKVLNKFKQFATPGLDFEDMIAEANIAIFNAWMEWNPAESLFNTFATNMLNWHMYRFMDTYHPIFKMNVKTKNDLRAQGETFASIKKKGKTTDVTFNKEFGLTGGKKGAEFTREMWNTYVYRKTTKTFGSGIQNVMNECEYHSADHDDNFNILEQASTEDNGVPSDIQKSEWLNDSKRFGEMKQKVVAMLLEGHSLDVIAKEIGMTKFKMAEKFGKLDLRAENA